MKFFIDAETLPPDKDDPLIKNKINGYTDDEYRQFALSGEYGRLLCIGIITERDGHIIHRGILGRDRETMRFHLDEARTLRSFRKLLQNFDDRQDLLIGFNLLDFDLLFLWERSIIKCVRPSFNISFARFRSHPVYDVMWEFTRWRHRIKLDDLANILGLQSSKKDGIDGSTVFDLFTEGRHQEIADYCLADVELTKQIYERMCFI